MDRSEEKILDLGPSRRFGLKKEAKKARRLNQRYGFNQYSKDKRLVIAHFWGKVHWTPSKPLKVHKYRKLWMDRVDGGTTQQTTEM